MSENHSDRWYRLSASGRSEAGGLVAEAAAAPDSPWFSGHFPGEPILPGIAQLSMVLETLRAAAGGKMRITGLRRVRFKQAVRPGERLKIHVQPNGKSAASHSFQIKVGDDIACSGTLIAEETGS
jgi:3-hydroxyacyl-[acyl-carrier-protein] dehydratase